MAKGSKSEKKVIVEVSEDVEEQEQVETPKKTKKESKSAKASKASKEVEEPVESVVEKKTSKSAKKSETKEKTPSKAAKKSETKEKTPSKAAKKSETKGKKEKVVVQKGGDDEEVETEGKKYRSFKAYYVDPSGEIVQGGRYCGIKPKQAACKALTGIFKIFKLAGQKVAGDVKFGVIETTRNSHRKKYWYSGTREKLDKPIKIDITKTDEKTGKVTVSKVTYRYNNKVVKASKEECGALADCEPKEVDESQEAGAKKPKAKASKKADSKSKAKASKKADVKSKAKVVKKVDAKEKAPKKADAKEKAPKKADAKGKAKAEPKKGK
jgi:hypothetical protein